jgi:uncharacterized phosphosugar-binding protein
VAGSAEGFAGKPTRHSCGKTLFELADVVIDTCVPATDASVTIPHHVDRIAPLSTAAFVAVVWMTISTVAERLIERGVHLHIHPSHNIPGDTTAPDRLAGALTEYKRRVASL